MEPAASKGAAILAGDVRAASRLMRGLGDGDPQARLTLAWLYRASRRIPRVGITGPPGAGKSTLASALVGWWRAQGMRVGVLAVDPSSPFSGGALLGDRVRMMAHAEDDGVFIRSQATRGALGGVGATTVELIGVFDAMGFDIVLVETVGVGQDEVDVIQLVDTTVVVAVPGMGDEVQALKAGLLEVADILVVNKADRDGAERTTADLQAMVDIGPTQSWRRPIIATVAHLGAGVADLGEAIRSHGAWLDDQPGDRGRRQTTAAHIERISREDMGLRVRRWLENDPGGRALVDDVHARRQDPYAGARQALEAVVQGQSGDRPPNEGGDSASE